MITIDSDCKMDREDLSEEAPVELCPWDHLETSTPSHFQMLHIASIPGGQKCPRMRTNIDPTIANTIRLLGLT